MKTTTKENLYECICELIMGLRPERQISQKKGIFKRWTQTFFTQFSPLKHYRHLILGKRLQNLSIVPLNGRQSMEILAVL